MDINLQITDMGEILLNIQQLSSILFQPYENS